MNSKLKLIGTLALATVSATAAFAQSASSFANGYASQTSYVYSSQPGIYITGFGGNYSYYDFGPYSTVGSYSYDFPYGSNGNIAAAGIQGFGGSFAIPGGTIEEAEAVNYNWLSLTNFSSNYNTLVVNAYTAGYGSAYHSSWNSEGIADGWGEVYDTNGAFFQESYAQAVDEGFGGGNSWYGFNYDSYGYYSAGQFYGNQGSFSTWASFSDNEWYYITLAPGQSDTIYSVAGELHGSYAITPGPAAVAPFALGLFGAFRRGRKV